MTPLPNELPEGYQQHPSGLIVPRSAMPTPRSPALIERTPFFDDDGTGEVGTIINDAWKQELYNQIDAALAAVSAQLGAAWVNVPYAATNYSAGWSVTVFQQEVFSYVVIGRALILTLRIVGSTPPAGATNVSIALPFAFSHQGIGSVTMQFPSPGGPWEVGIAQCWEQDTRVWFARDGWVAFPSGSTLGVNVTIVLGI